MSHITAMISSVISPYPGRQSILVLDNCRIHHAQEDALRAAVSAKGGLLFFLAPYCCIDNPEEYGFSVFESCWRRHAAFLRGEQLDNAIAWCFQNCYAYSAERKRNADQGPLNTFVRCGYVFA
jgi:transposase